MPLSPKKKKYLKWSAITLISLASLIFLSNYSISTCSEDLISADLTTLPDCKTGLILGTNPMLGGYPNPYFVNRINAGAELFHAGKVKYLIVSGDNGRDTYNEPEEMKNQLVALGVPDSCVYLDYAGFRTFDSMIRAKEIFGQDTLIVVSQQFHNERAVFIGRHYDIQAYGYNAKDAVSSIDGHVETREVFARVKVFIDMLIGKEPKFLGEKIAIGH